MPLTEMAIVQVHGTAIAWNGAAVLLRGPSGAGKSDLALRCISTAAEPFATVRALLVADDQVMLTRRDTALIATSPLTIKGQLEVRGLGIVSVPTTDEAVLRLVIDLVVPSEVERMPDAGRTTAIGGMTLPLVVLTPFEASAPLKVLLALNTIVQSHSP